MTHYASLSVITQHRCNWVDITALISEEIVKSNIREGICTVASTHTTAGMTINENADPSVGRDLFWKMQQLIPQSESYHHAEGNSDSHLKASLVGFSVTLPIHKGDLVLGIWQAIYFCEFDGPRSRTVTVMAVGE